MATDRPRMVTPAGAGELVQLDIHEDPLDVLMSMHTLATKAAVVPLLFTVSDPWVGWWMDTHQGAVPREVAFVPVVWGDELALVCRQHDLAMVKYTIDMDPTEGRVT